MLDMLDLMARRALARRRGPLEYSSKSPDGMLSACYYHPFLLTLFGVR
jgi:hypothetical protein